MNRCGSTAGRSAAPPRVGSTTRTTCRRAEQTATWFIGGNGEIGGDAGNGQAPRFDADGITHLIETIKEHNAAWESWFTSWGIQPHAVRYEELDTDMVATTQPVLDFLGLALPAGRTIVARHQRQADELNRQWIRRYREEAANSPGATSC
ncbi:Stf0 family sulfotransferase [Micromonospora sp. NBC_00389]|uniref:Stf0 family sulfotransferase n=1 Tax=Micromonospora sp. NBC_00389 TaxID=2903586 RepID=UPI002E2145D0